MKPEIIYEDNHILVAVKPPNLPSQADSSGDLDFLSICREYLRISKNKPGAAYIGLVHRLDRPAGGLMVMAVTTKAASRLSAQFAEHTAGRNYLAVVQGCPPQGSAVHYLKEIGGKARASAHAVPGSKRAELSLELLSNQLILSTGSKEYSLVRVVLQTGRKHQIRAQLAAMGHPLYGDQRYAFGVAKPGEQLGLWGFQLKLTHPITGQEMTFFSLPKGGIWDEMGVKDLMRK